MKGHPSVPCVLALGGNIGDVPAAFRSCVGFLSDNGFRVENVSSFVESEPVDCPPGTPRFTNAVLLGEWAGTPEELLRLCQAAEEGAGRPRSHGKNTPRPLDVDLILFGDLRIRTEELTIPHPRAAERAFVMGPLEEIAPHLLRVLRAVP